MNTILAFLFFILILTGYASAQRSNSKADIEGDIIYSLEQNTRKEKIKFWFIHSKDSTRYLISTKVLKDGAFSYIKIGGKPYYLNCNEPPSLVNDICNELKKIEPDTTLRYGEPLAKGITVAFLINNKGEIVTSGLARKASDTYYENKTLQLLKKYNSQLKEPSRLQGKAVSCLLRISCIFGQGPCSVVPF